MGEGRCDTMPPSILVLLLFLLLALVIIQKWYWIGRKLQTFWNTWVLLPVFFQLQLSWFFFWFFFFKSFDFLFSGRYVNVELKNKQAWRNKLSHLQLSTKTNPNLITVASLLCPKKLPGLCLSQGQFHNGHCFRKGPNHCHRVKRQRILLKVSLVWRPTGLLTVALSRVGPRVRNKICHQSSGHTCGTHSFLDLEQQSPGNRKSKG